MRTDLREAVSGRRELDEGMVDALRFLLRRLRANVFTAQNLLEKQVGVGAGLGGGYSRFEAADEIERLEEFFVEPVPSWRDLLLHGERNP
jgi:4-diphosphocytidyl-2C-methyl-D-erythritol kinase